MFSRYITSATKDVFEPSNPAAFGPILNDLKIVVVNVYSEDRSACCNMLFCDSRSTFQRLTDENSELFATFNTERQQHLDSGASLSYEEKEVDDYVQAYLQAKLLADAKEQELRSLNK